MQWIKKSNKYSQSIVLVLKTKKYSIVIVSHDKSHFKTCDRIYKLN